MFWDKKRALLDVTTWVVNVYLARVAQETGLRASNPRSVSRGRATDWPMTQGGLVLTSSYIIPTYFIWQTEQCLQFTVCALQADVLACAFRQPVGSATWGTDILGQA